MDEVKKTPLERVSEFFNACSALPASEQEEIWALVSAVRGPDVSKSKYWSLKTFTHEFRTVLSPKFFQQNPHRVIKVPKRLVGETDQQYTERITASVYAAGGKSTPVHFAQHIANAYLALNLSVERRASIAQAPARFADVPDLEKAPQDADKSAPYGSAPRSEA